MTRILAAGVPVLLAVFWLVGTAAWNRSAVLARVTLTEHEAPWHAAGAEGPVRVSIDWVRRDDPQDARNWLTPDRLRAIGFNVARPATAPESERAYSRMAPRRAWVVFEYGGEAWQLIERRRELASDRGWRTSSRLVPVDAGPDRRALAERHEGTPHVIVSAWIQMGWVGPGAGGPLVYGFIRAIEPPSITLPRRWAATLRTLAPLPLLPRAMSPEDVPSPLPAAPRYEVDLAIGRLGIPWVEEVR
jgi:hypothetical protein